MGRWHPKSASTSIKPHPGTFDPATGLWDYPDEEEPLTWTRLTDPWELLEGAFQATYNIDLDNILTSRTFRWFAARVTYLLADDNPYSRQFRDD